MQLEVFPNPLVRARRVYPYVVVLQADIAATGRDRVIAFLVARRRIGPVTGRLMPIVEIGGQEFVVLMPSITNVPVTELRRAVGDLTAYRSQIVNALDWMFLGI
ncbi:MAG: CcdB family protein [Reyranellales bacterium]|jgi:toxin CcdB